MTDIETDSILKNLGQMKNLLEDCIAIISSKGVRKVTKAPARKSQNSQQVGSSNGSEVEIITIVNKIRDCDETENIEQYILDKKSQDERILLPFYICSKFFPDRKLNSREIEEITDCLGVKIAQNNVASIIKQRLLRYLSGDSRRSRGKATNYKLNRRGVQYIESIINPK